MVRVLCYKLLELQREQVLLLSQNVYHSSSPDQTEQNSLEGGSELRDAERIDGRVNEGVTHQ